MLAAHRFEMSGLEPTRRLRLLIAYDGGPFHGWQSGRSGMGVADHLSAVLVDALEMVGDLVSSSRTDSGVHAHGLVAHADVPAAIGKRSPDAIRALLNSKLPATIRVRQVAWVSPRFHARFGAVSKEYRYLLWNDPVMNPLWRDQAWHVSSPLDIEAMRRAAKRFIGRHDFRAFTSKRDGVLGSSEREITRLTITRKGPAITLAVVADGFLYKMCRAIVGTLVHAGMGRITEREIDELLISGASRTPGPNAPAHGLILWNVRYAPARKDHGAESK